MTMTQGEAVTRLRQRLEESTASMWTDPMLRRWLYEGAKDLARYTESIEDKTTIPVSSGTAEYSGPTNVVKIASILFTATGSTLNNPLEYLDVDVAQGVFYTGSTGTPRAFTLWKPAPNMAIRLYPTPSLAGTLTVWYRRLPTALAFDDTSGDATAIDFPEAWLELILDYAEARALRRDRDPRWTESQGLYQQGREEMLIRTQRHADAPGAIYSTGAASAVAALEAYDSGW